MTQAALVPIVESAPIPGQRTRYFCGRAQGCVVERGEERDVYVGGVLLGTWRVGETRTRNVLLVALSQDRRIRLGKLAEAFGLSEERVRRIRRQHEAEGVEAIVGEKKGGLARKRGGELEAKLEALFDAGFTIKAATKRLRGKVSHTLVGRVHRDYVLKKRAEKNRRDEVDTPMTGLASSTPGVAEPNYDLTVANAANDVTDAESPQLPLTPKRSAVEQGAAPTPPLPDEDETRASGLSTTSAGASDKREDELCPESPLGLDAATELEASDTCDAGSTHIDSERQECSLEAALERGGNRVQHLGVWLVLAMLNHWGVYQLLERLRADFVRDARQRSGRIGAVALRVVTDAVVAALCIEQQCVEGVRRIATASAPTLLRFARGISPTWARRVLGRFAEKRGEMFHLATASLLLRQTDDESPSERALFYIDNHMRPYTGKHTLRKGWRMQAKRAQPGSSDYYVHDEDGRPVMRFECPDHASMTKMLLTIGRTLRDLLDNEKARVVLVFDRAGAYPTQMAELRDAGFDFITYERAPYQQLPKTQFEREFELDGERIAYVEQRKKNLRGGRGRVRRICAQMADEHQVNVLAISKEEPEEVIRLLTERWGRQENQFKHAGSRWGINQLDGRAVQPYPEGTVIPNPARRRLDRALKLSRAAEAKLLRELSLLDANDEGREKLDSEVQRQRQLQQELLAQRPSVPKHAPIEETELAGKLVHHEPRYKLVLDTLRTLLANVESELAAQLGPPYRSQEDPDQSHCRTRNCQAIERPRDHHTAACRNTT